MVSNERPGTPADMKTGDAVPASVGADGYGLLVMCESGSRSQRLSPQIKAVLGRNTTCDVAVADQSVSREHAVIHPGHPPQVEDLGSHNGTRVHGKRLEKGERHPLSLGTVIQLGSATLIVQRSEVMIRPPMRGAPDGDEAADSAPGLVLEDPTMQQLHALAGVVAPSDLCVLILGETGVGKEIFAETLHRRSARAGHHFLRLNCAALSETLLESELFGHERGAFTGALQTKLGLFESADGGTVFLDEIGELPLSTQAKLLRVLESGEVLRVGSLRPTYIDVRFLSATNRNLEDEVAEGRFRADLFFRLNGVAVTLPPLRDRPLDLEALSDSFSAAASTKIGKMPPMFSAGAREALRAHAWPGNIRELRNVIERATLLCRGGLIESADLSLGSPRVRREPSITPRK